MFLRPPKAQHPNHVAGSATRIGQHMTSENNTRRFGQVGGQIDAVFATANPAEFLTPASLGRGPTALEPECLPSRSAVVAVKRGSNAGSCFMMDWASLSAGRHSASDIFLDDITVSRRHAEFRCEKGQFCIIGVRSLNGIYVNRQPVDSATLAIVDEIQFGNFRLTFFTDLKPADTNNKVRIQ